jgi:hypothetical protein
MCSFLEAIVTVGISGSSTVISRTLNAHLCVHLDNEMLEVKVKSRDDNRKLHFAFD